MIGVFSSGVGGITVVRALKDALPEYDIIYFGDTGRTPYDNKSLAAISTFTLQGIDFLLQKGAKLLIIASNAGAGAIAGDMAEQQKAPWLEIITPAVQQALKTSRHSRIGVIGTRATIACKIYEQKIRALDPQAKVYSREGALLVPLVEEGWLKKPETVRIVKKCIYPLKVRQIDTLILGCTHFGWLKEIFKRKMGSNIRIIDPTVTVVGTIKTFLRCNPGVDSQLGKTGRTRFFVSDISEHFQKTARAFFGGHIQLERSRVQRLNES